MNSMLKPWMGTIGASLAAAAIAFVSNIISARLLGPEGRGDLAAAMLIITSSAVFAQLGFGQSLVFQVRSQIHDQRPLVRISLVVVAVLAAALAIIGAHSIPSWRESQLLLVGAAVAYALMTFFQQASQLQPSLILFNLLRVVPPAMVVIGMISIAALSTLDPPTAVLIQAGASVVAAIIGGVVVERLIRRDAAADRNLMTEFRAYFVRALSYYGLLFAGFVTQNLDKAYLLFVASAHTMGLYVTAFAASRAAGYFYEGLGSVLYSRFAGSNSADVGLAIDRTIRMTFLPAMLGCAVAALISAPLMSLLFGEEFRPAAALFAILVLESVVGSASFAMAQQFNAIGRPGLVLLRQLGALLPVLLGLAFIDQDNVGLSLAILLLAGSTLRLVISMLMFRMIGLKVPSLIPRRQDWHDAKKLLGARFKR